MTLTELKSYFAPDNLSCMFHNVPNTPENRAFISAYLKKRGIKRVWMRGRTPVTPGLRARWNGRPYSETYTHSLPLNLSKTFGVYVTLPGVYDQDEYRRRAKNVMRMMVNFGLSKEASK